MSRRGTCGRAARQDRVETTGLEAHDRQLHDRVRREPRRTGTVGRQPASSRRRQDRMASDWERLISSLGDVERERLRSAFDADPELAEGVRGVLADMPLETCQQVLRRLAVRLEQAPLGGGALIAALTDVVYDAMKRSEQGDG